MFFMDFFKHTITPLQKREAIQLLVNISWTGISVDRWVVINIPKSIDQLIKFTINRSSKERGDLSGNTENVGASNRWIRINHYMAALTEYLHGKIRKVARSSRAELRSSYPGASTRMKKQYRDLPLGIMNGYQIYSRHHNLSSMLQWE